MQEIKIFAPVLIPTLCRYEHFKRCVESLSRCTHADKTELYIGLDYPANDSHRDGYSKILKYLDRGVDGFKSVNVFKRKKNCGVYENLGELHTEVFKTHDRIILSEDDNEFSPNFLDYINRGLTIYEHNDDVFAICGYNYPIDMTGYEFNNYRMPILTAWGVGFWRDSFLEVRDKIVNFTHVKKILRNPRAIYALLKTRPSSILGLINILKLHSLHGDVLFGSYLNLNNKYSILPKVSKVKNWGHDGSGINCGNLVDDIFIKQEIDSDAYFTYDIVSNTQEELLPYFKTYLCLNMLFRFKVLVRYFIYILGIY